MTTVQYVIVLTVSGSPNFVPVCILVNTNNLALLGACCVYLWVNEVFVFKVYLWVCLQGSPPLRPSFWTLEPARIPIFSTLPQVRHFKLLTSVPVIYIYLYSVLLRMNLYWPGFLTGAVVLPGIDRSRLKHCLIFLRFNLVNFREKTNFLRALTKLIFNSTLTRSGAFRYRPDAFKALLNICMHTSPLVTLTGCILGRSRAHNVGGGVEEQVNKGT
jgi:hypothetical protein